MAKCRCGICKSRRESGEKSLDNSSPFHTEVRKYEVSGGAVLPAGLQRVCDLLSDFTTGVPDLGELDRDRILAYCQNNPYWQPFATLRSEFPVRDVFLSYLNKIPGWTYPGCDITPESYVTSGHSEADALKNLQQSLKRWLRWYSDRRVKLPDMPATPHSIVEAIGDAWVTKDGKFTTRLANELFKHGVKLSKDQLETIANALSDFVSRDGKYDFTFDQGFVAGDAEEYCHRDSCWWGGYSSARPMLAGNGGYALRMWENGKPVARCWIAPVADGYVMFNAYGKMDLGLFARVISTSWGLKYGKCSMLYPESIYVNNGSGFHLHAEDPKTVVDICHWSRQRSQEYVAPNNPCEVCGEELPAGETLTCYLCHEAYEPVEASAPISITFAGPMGACSNLTEYLTATSPEATTTLLNPAILAGAR